MSRNYLQSWEFREQYARDMETDDLRRAAALGNADADRERVGTREATPAVGDTGPGSTNLKATGADQ